MHNLIPGTFNPLHDGHLAIFEYLQGNAVFGITQDHCHKLVPDVSIRIKKFKEYGLPHLVFSGYFIELHHYNICIGSDVADYLTNDKNYPSHFIKKYFFQQLAKQHISFKIFPRHTRISNHDLEFYIPTSIATDFQMIDISSTEIRKR